MIASRRPVRRRAARMALAVALATTGACGSCGEPARTANVGSLTLDVPDDWTVELQRKGPVENLALRPPRGGLWCRVVVMRGKEDAPSPSPTAFIEGWQQRLGGTEHGEVSLDSGIGRIDGHILHGVELPGEAGDDTRLEAYGIRHDDAMIGAVIGWIQQRERDRRRRENEAQRNRDDCFGALETLRPAD